MAESIVNSFKRFSDAEMEIIVEHVRKDYDVLTSSFTNQITNNAKNAIWAKITKSVNAVAKKTRKPADIRKKWSDLRNCTNKKEADRKKEMRKTGKSTCQISLNVKKTPKCDRNVKTFFELTHR